MAKQKPLPPTQALEPPPPGLRFDPGLITQPPRAGDICPQCGQGVLDYDGMLNLACAACGFALAGSCT